MTIKPSRKNYGNKQNKCYAYTLKIVWLYLVEYLKNLIWYKLFILFDQRAIHKKIIIFEGFKKYFFNVIILSQGFIKHKRLVVF